VILRLRRPRREARSSAARVSVVVPLYNHARFVEAAIASVLRQGPILHEVIIVDDGSTDESADIASRVAAEDPRIVLWSQPNRGAHAAINAGLHRSTGELLAILNSDDVYTEGRLEVLAAVLDADPSADIAASGIGFMDDTGAAAQNEWYERAVAFHQERGDLGLALVNGNFLMTTSNYLMRRCLPEAIGYFAPLRYAHDLDFALRVVTGVRRFVLVREKLLHYRLHASNTISENHAQVRLEWAAVTGFFLARLWAQGRADGNWAWMRAMEDVLEKHALARAVHLCQAYFSRHRTDSMERSPFFSDQAFREFLSGYL
jgi:glycosyltransferase involved in cell wall biosynthesis